MTERILLVGRHVGQLPAEFDVVEQQSVGFSTELMECAAQVGEIFARAASLDAVPVFQNTPGIVAAVLSKVSGRWGVIVSKPGERKAGVTEIFHFHSNDCAPLFLAEVAEKAVKFVNARAKTSVSEDGDILAITVDPVGEFVFDHIEFVEEA